MSHQSDLDNHANQMNSNNDAYWESRDEERPDDWDHAADHPDAPGEKSDAAAGKK